MTPPPSDEIGTGELSRLIRSIHEQLGSIDAKLEQRPKWADIERIEQQLAARLAKLEAGGTWLSRALGQLLITAGFAAVVYTNR